MADQPGGGSEATAQHSLQRSRRLIEALLRPQAYPHPTRTIRLQETHAAWVVLTGSFAYKVKKPVDYGFLDYSTLDRRRFFCQEEVRLNRRFAPDLYLDVVSIRGTPAEPRVGGDGPLLEYAVCMRQFPADGLLSRVAERGRLSRRYIDQMIEEVAAFHRRADVAAPQSGYGRAARIHHWVTENFEHIGPPVAGAERTPQLNRLRRWADGERERLDAAFEQRRIHGFVRECHGDLHLGNLTLIDDRVTLFDCLEFNPELRWIDVMSDVAFLTMDLRDRGYPGFSHRFLNGYLHASGDYAGVRVLRYYQFYRAMVRAKVAALRGAQAGTGSPVLRQAREEYRDYLKLASAYTAQGSPALVLVHGLSGSGKSTLAQALCEAQGMISVRSDVERKRLAGLDALSGSGSALGAGLYTQAATQQTYRRLAELAGLVLDEGYTVLVDATFLKLAQRQRFQALAAGRRVAFAILDCRAPLAELRRRIEARQGAGADASEATLAVLDAQRAGLEPLSDAERAVSIEVDTTAADGLAAVVAVLRKRGVIPGRDAAAG
jgi:aminoglycoside phosphotransferase family enzyme/predicted kinase